MLSNFPDHTIADISVFQILCIGRSKRQRTEDIGNEGTAQQYGGQIGARYISIFNSPPSRENKKESVTPKIPAAPRRLISRRISAARYPLKFSPHSSSLLLSQINFLPGHSMYQNDLHIAGAVPISKYQTGSAASSCWSS